ncbi:unnamed protein product [Urochloa humidicola]
MSSIWRLYKKKKHINPLILIQIPEKLTAHSGLPFASPKRPIRRTPQSDRSPPVRRLASLHSPPASAARRTSAPPLPTWRPTRLALPTSPPQFLLRAPLRHRLFAAPTSCVASDLLLQDYRIEIGWPICSETLAKWITQTVGLEHQFY